MLLAFYFNAPDHTESYFCFSITVMSSVFIAVRETHQQQKVCSRVNIVVVNLDRVFHVQNAYNKAVQSDNLRAVCLVVSLSFHFTTRQTAHKLRLTAALYPIGSYIEIFTENRNNSRD